MVVGVWVSSADRLTGPGTTDVDSDRLAPEGTGEKVTDAAIDAGLRRCGKRVDLGLPPDGVGGLANCGLR